MSDKNESESLHHDEPEDQKHEDGLNEKHEGESHHDDEHHDDEHEKHADGERGAPEPHGNGEGDASPGGVVPPHVAKSTSAGSDLGVTSGAVPNDYPGGNPAMRHASGHPEQMNPDVQRQHAEQINDFLTSARSAAVMQTTAAHDAGDPGNVQHDEADDDGKEDEEKKEEGK